RRRTILVAARHDRVVELHGHALTTSAGQAGVELDVDAGERLGDRAVLLGGLGLLAEGGVVDAGPVGGRGELAARGAKPAVGALEVDAGRRVDRVRGVSGALEAGGERHREATGVGGADQLLGIRSRAVLEARGERVLALEGAASQAHGPFALLETAFP